MPLKVDRLITNSLNVNGVSMNRDTKHYELDITGTSVVTVDTTTGIIDILGLGTDPFFTPGSAFTSSVSFYIENPALDLSVDNRDNVYVQYSLYYNQTIDDNAIPYLISTGFVSQGLEFKLYNASPATLGSGEYQGPLYVYFELYTLN
jgi:hypothetical protein